MNTRLVGYPVAVALGIVAAWIAVNMLTPVALINPRWVGESNTIRNCIWTEELDPAVFDSVPRGDYPISELDYRIRNDLMIDLYEKDFSDQWDNPRRFVAEDRPEGVFVGVYSTGRDGQSTTQGNDKDDINSWGQDGRDYYRRADRQREFRRQILEVGLGSLLTISAFVLLFKCRLLNWSNKR